jgi:hypothetical protein
MKIREREIKFVKVPIPENTSVLEAYYESYHSQKKQADKLKRSLWLTEAILKVTDRWKWKVGVLFRIFRTLILFYIPFYVGFELLPVNWLDGTLNTWWLIPTIVLIFIFLIITIAWSLLSLICYCEEGDSY